MQDFSRKNTKKFKLVRKKSRLFKKFAHCRFFNFLIKLHGTACIAPKSVIAPLLQEYAALGIDNNNARTDLKQRTMPDSFSQIKYILRHD